VARFVKPGSGFPRLFLHRCAKASGRQPPAKNAAHNPPVPAEKPASRGKYLHFYVAFPLKRGNMENVRRSRACSLTFCCGKKGAGEKEEAKGRIFPSCIFAPLR
jgi:hypothetical protein